MAVPPVIQVEDLQQNPFTASSLDVILLWLDNIGFAFYCSQAVEALVYGS